MTEPPEKERARRSARDYALPYLLMTAYVGDQWHRPGAVKLALLALGMSYLTGLLRSREEALGPDDLQLGLAHLCFFVALVSGVLAGLALL